MTKRELSMAKKMAKRMDSYAKVFSDDAGADVLYDIMATHYVLSSTFDPNPYVMALKEGERNVVLRILKMLNTDVKTIKERIKLNENVLEE